MLLSTHDQTLAATPAKATQFSWRRLLTDKSFLTNALAVVVTVAGYYSPIASQALFDMGIFALSGAFTNWIAIYMLFEKVPFLYGSGVVPNRFEEFKAGIRTMMMEQFFNAAHIERFFHRNLASADASQAIDFEPLLAQVDYEALYTKLLQTVLGSPLGPMLAMLGGEKALEPMKEPFITKMREGLNDMVRKPNFQSGVQKVITKSFDSKIVMAKLDEIVQARLDELTPTMVKVIVEDMIHAHLGWLVVWGGVFGAILGLIASLLK